MALLLLSEISITGLATFISIAVLTLALATTSYQLYLHPLRAFPGPILYRISRLGWAYHMCAGDWIFQVLAMHEKYGPVVRVAPDELSFIDPAAWKDIYGHKLGGDFPKAIRLFRGSRKFPVSLLVTEGREEHRTLRRRLAQGFSEQAMRLHGPVIDGYVSLLMTRLLENCNAGKRALDIKEWYNFTLFDMMGDLSFGESFGCLRNSKYHSWVAALNGMARQGSYLVALANIGFEWLIDLIFTSGNLSKRNANAKLTREKLSRRMTVERNDFIGTLLKDDGKNPPLSMDALQANASMLMLGGSETTSTLLSGVTYLLLTHPASHQRAVQEVRSSFGSVDEITLLSVSKLTFMHACISEALRRYPPAAGSQPRFVPRGGAEIAGHFVPEHTVVSIYPYAISLSTANFLDPFEFDPARFLGDQKYSSDRLDAAEPFSVGPRNCIGRNLTYAQSRLILANIIYSFDIRLAKDSEGWMNQKHNILWNKPPLNVYLTPVER